MPPDPTITPTPGPQARAASRALAGAVVVGLLIAAIEFASTRISAALSLLEQVAWLARLAVHWTLATIPLGVAIAVLEHSSRGHPPRLRGYALAVAVGAGAGAVVMALHGRFVDRSIAALAVGFDMELADRFLYGLWQLGFWGSVGALLHASSLRQRRGELVLRARELERLRTERALAEARLGAMQAQVEPEFVLSSLSAVEQLYEIDPAAADRVLDALIRFLREATPLLRRPGPVPGEDRRLLESCVQALRTATSGTRLDVDLAHDTSGRLTLHVNLRDQGGSRP